MRQKSKSKKSLGHEVGATPGIDAPGERAQVESPAPVDGKPTGLRGVAAENTQAAMSEEDRAREVGREYALQHLGYFGAGSEAPLARLAEALQEAGLPADSDTMSFCSEGFDEALEEQGDATAGAGLDALSLSTLSREALEGRVRDLLVEFQKVDPAIQAVVFEDDENDEEGEIILDVVGGDSVRRSIGDLENGISRHEGYAENLAYALSCCCGDGERFYLRVGAAGGAGVAEIVKERPSPMELLCDWFRGVARDSKDADVAGILRDAAAYFYLGEGIGRKRGQGETDNVFVEGAYRTRVTEIREADGFLQHDMSRELLEREGEFCGFALRDQASMNAFMDELVVTVGPKVRAILWPEPKSSANEDE